MDDDVVYTMNAQQRAKLIEVLHDMLQARAGGLPTYLQQQPLVVTATSLLFGTQGVHGNEVVIPYHERSLSLVRWGTESLWDIFSAILQEVDHAADGPYLMTFLEEGSVADACTTLRRLFWEHATIDFTDLSQQKYLIKDIGLRNAEESAHVFQHFAECMKRRNDMELAQHKEALQFWVDHFSKEKKMPQDDRKRVQYFAIRLSMVHAE